jgi:uncharacterized protein
MSFTNLDLVEEYELGNGERGIRARADFPVGTVIGVYDGEARPFALRDGRMVDNDQHKDVVQIRVEGDLLYGLVSAPGSPFYGIDYINHSCEPNITFRDRIVLLAAVDVRAGERLTIDYRAWDLIPEGIECWCEPSRCAI